MSRKCGVLQRWLGGTKLKEPAKDRESGLPAAPGPAGRQAHHPSGVAWGADTTPSETATRPPSALPTGSGLTIYPAPQRAHPPKESPRRGIGGEVRDFREKRCGGNPPLFNLVVSCRAV